MYRSGQRSQWGIYDTKQVSDNEVMTFDMQPLWLKLYCNSHNYDSHYNKTYCPTSFCYHGNHKDKSQSTLKC